MIICDIYEKYDFCSVVVKPFFSSEIHVFLCEWQMCIHGEKVLDYVCMDNGHKQFSLSDPHLQVFYFCLPCWWGSSPTMLKQELLYTY